MPCILCACNKLASYTLVVRTLSFNIVYVYTFIARHLWVMGIYAQVISYAEGVRLSSRLGRAISDVSGRDRVCIYYNMFMRVCASVWIEDACMYIIIYIYLHKDYGRLRVGIDYRRPRTLVGGHFFCPVASLIY